MYSRIIPTKILSTVITPISPADVSVDAVWYKAGNWNGGIGSDGYFDFATNKVYAGGDGGLVQLFMVPANSSAPYSLNGHDIFSSNGGIANLNTNPNNPTFDYFFKTANGQNQNLCLVLKSNDDNGGGIFGTYASGSFPGINFNTSLEIRYLSGILHFNFGQFLTQTISSVSFAAPKVKTSFQIIFLQTFYNDPNKSIRVYYDGQIYNCPDVSLIFNNYGPGFNNTQYFGVNLLDQNTAGIRPSFFYLGDILYSYNITWTIAQINSLGTFLSQRDNIPFYPY